VGPVVAWGGGVEVAELPQATMNDRSNIKNALRVGVALLDLVSFFIKYM